GIESSAAIKALQTGFTLIALLTVSSAVTFNASGGAKRAFFVFKTFESLKSFQDKAFKDF
uniref:hypothetical protein n=1 Tax=Neisseria dentiae TaxID=194197 RepID=UPI0035A02E22